MVSTAALCVRHSSGLRPRMGQVRGPSRCCCRDWSSRCKVRLNLQALYMWDRGFGACGKRECGVAWCAAGGADAGRGGGDAACRRTPGHEHDDVRGVALGAPPRTLTPRSTRPRCASSTPTARPPRAPPAATAPPGWAQGAPAAWDGQQVLPSRPLPSEVDIMGPGAYDMHMGMAHIDRVSAQSLLTSSPTHSPLISPLTRSPDG